MILQRHLFVGLIAKLLWVSGFPTTIGIILIAIDLALLLPLKRRGVHRPSDAATDSSLITIALTAYDDELSIALAVREFLSHPRVKRVIVVSNNSKDRTLEFAIESGSTAVNEDRQ